MQGGTQLVVDPNKPVHPTFLYESLWCLLSFAFLYFYYKKLRKFSGQLFLLYGVLYGTERAIVEGLRTDSLYIGDTNIRVSQLLSVILVFVCGVLYIALTIKYTRNPKPIEGIDFYKEIPLYRYNKKADDARKLFEAADAKAKEAEEAAGEDDALRAKAADLRQKADDLKAKYDEARRLAEEDAARIAAKRQRRKSRKSEVGSQQS